MKTPHYRTPSSLFEQNPSDVGLGKKNPMKKSVVSTHHSSMIVHFVGAGSLWKCQVQAKILTRVSKLK
jgi:hypothetical protein